MRASLVLLKLPPSWPKRILGNSAIPWQGKPPDFHFIDFLVKTSILIFYFYFYLFIYFFGRLRIGEPEHLRMRGRNVWTREKNAVPPDTGAGASYQTSHPGISARAIAFGRSWPFAAFCYRPCLPVRHWGRDMSAPKPYVTNPTPTHSSKPPLSI